ncbi:ion transporter [Nonlabens ponticola]|uniref:Ion transporter n=1 Tax=Nonlabens ponticola TaxID=2496866 RepID=A0A3S9MY09_9FLAO|nr:ion transporter [Nonlabens ponticola]AZQ44027.1 ion transporter [Nonlabens ponticola]
MPKSTTKISSAWRRKIHEVIYEADTPVGKAFDVTLLIVIIISVLLVLLESVPALGAKYADEFILAEWIITVFFTIEYILRIISINKPTKYIFSFYGIIDFLSTIPLYLTFFIGGINALLAVRALRLLRVFRILKITRFIGEADKLSKAIKSSLPKILVFLFAVLVISIIMGTIMYLVEGAESGFVSIPVSIYWCIVTLTTVGFGDIAPVTPMGQFLATIIMIMGYGIIAVPTGIVSAEYTTGGKDSDDSDNGKLQIEDPNYRHVNTQVCQNCMARKHQDDAEYCHKCGYSLDV